MNPYGTLPSAPSPPSPSRRLAQIPCHSSVLKTDLISAIAIARSPPEPTCANLREPERTGADLSPPAWSGRRPGVRIDPGAYSSPSLARDR